MKTMNRRFVVDDLACATTTNPPVPILHGLSLDIEPGEVVGLIGESGSGKTMASLAILDLLPAGVVATGGTLGFEGVTRSATEPAAGSGREARRGLAAIFQNPREALNPTMRVGQQVVRVLRTHGAESRKAAEQQAIELLRRCGVPGAANVVGMFPHQLSGGMCQRVMVAMALAAEPTLLLADEPTTALDMTVQAQIIRLLRDVIDESGCSVLLITHDLGVVAELCDRVVVLLGGRVMERTTVEQLFDDPLHPYTRFLVDPVHVAGAGEVVAPGAQACPFVSRCPQASEPCRRAPALHTLDDGRAVACVLYEGAVVEGAA